MKRISKIYLFAIFSVLLYSCESKEKLVERILDSANNFDLVYSDKWFFEVKMPVFEDYYYIELTKVENDITKTLVGSYKKVDNIIVFENQRLDVAIEKDSIKTRFILQSQYDTLYIYRYPVSDPGFQIFIKGKYRYQNDYSELSKGQQAFYNIHKDSLDNIRGNNLPELPELPIKISEKEIDIPIEEPKR